MIVCYCRKSRVSETDELDRQVRLVKEYCKSKQYTISKVFAEVGSSVDADRPEYTAMLKLLSNTKGCTIVVTDLDRLSRHTVILGLFQQLCKEQGHLVELTNGTVYNYSDYTDSFTSDIIASVSAYIYQQTKAKMYRGMLQARKEGKRIGAKPYGYTIANKRLVVNPEQVDTVRKVFKLISEGIATAEVVRILKNEGITTNTGRSFDTRAIRLMVQNEGYTGQKGDNIYPPIIDKELFLLANSKLKSIPNNGGKRSYALSGKIICEKCGASLIIGWKNDRGGAVINSCNSSNSIRKIKSNCTCQGCRLDIVNNLVISDCKAHLEIKLAELYKKLTEDKELLSSHNAELQATQAEIAANKGKLSRLNTLFVMDNISQEELTEKSAEIKDRISLLELKLQRLEGYSLFKIAEELQDKVVSLEELRECNNINDIVKLVDHVEYYKDQYGIQIKTVFRE